MLVTHHVDLVFPIVAYIVKLREGRIEAQGTVSQLREVGKLVTTRTAFGDNGKVKIADVASDERVNHKTSMDSGGKLVEEEQKDRYACYFIITRAGSRMFLF